MSEPKLVSPMLDNFLMGDPISDHAGVRCCPAMKENTEERYIVKIISNPASAQRLEALLLTGAYPDAQSAATYFKELTDNVIAEVNTLRQLSEIGGFIPFADYQLEAMGENEIGYDVYLLSEYRRSLERQFIRKPLTHLGAVNLGLDICSALTLCRRAGYLYIDLKPSNIFVVNDNQYKIGDLGFVSLASLKYASLPDKYRSAYTAPELSDIFANLNTTIDVYALGLILYQAYNGGALPDTEQLKSGEKLPAPEFADYEMAEIILKACDPDPQARWQDPAMMGQALVTYMQRNSVNDTPIIPPPAPEPPVEQPVVEESTVSEDTEQICAEDVEENIPGDTEEPVDEAPVDDEISSEEITPDPIDDIVDEQQINEDSSEVNPIYNEDDFGNLSFLNMDEDETTQEINAEDIEYEEVTDEVSEMMQQVDEIANYEVPEPVVAPEPIDIPIPDPITLLEVMQQEVENAEAAESEETEEEDDAEESTCENTPADEETESAEDTVSEQSDTSEEEETCEENTDEDATSYEIDPQPKKHPVRNIILGILAIALILGGYLFYKLYYLQSIDAIIISGVDNTMVVTIQTKADESILSIVSTSASGDRVIKQLTNGKAEFTDLIPGEEYTITVETSGFHKLQGIQRKTYYAPKPVNIMQITANTGEEAGSVVIDFLADGKSIEQWQISYTTGNQPEQTIAFSGNTVTLTDLTVGQTYKIKISPAESAYVVGEQEITYTAQEPVSAEDLTISSFKENKLTVTWRMPEGAKVSSWTVHCYNNDGYSETRVTDQTAYTFENIDITKDYFIEVCASGHKSIAYTNVKESSVIIDNFEIAENELGQITLSWSADSIPEGGWIVEASIPGSSMVNTYPCDGNSCLIKDAIPGQNYELSIRAASDSPVICNPISYATKEADDFSGKFSNAPVSRKDLKLTLYKAPSQSGYGYADVKKSEQTSTFNAGENAVFAMDVTVYYGPNKDNVSVMIVYEDANGIPVFAQCNDMVWESMWSPIYHGILPLPQLPSASGEYTVSVYFNGGLVHQQTMTIN